MPSRPRERDGEGRVNENEARRIAAVTSTIREDWHPAGLMSILADRRLVGRSFEGMLRVFVDLALDPATRRPTRVFESGPWWLAAGPRGETANVPPRSRADDCDVCHGPRHPDRADHAYEPLGSRGPGVKAPASLHALLATTPSTDHHAPRRDEG